jgi:hypothetical protein
MHNALDLISSSANKTTEINKEKRKKDFQNFV